MKRDRGRETDRGVTERQGKVVEDGRMGKMAKCNGNMDGERQRER